MADNLYNDLDPLYRAIWGPSLHHGLWLTGRESAKEARQNLITHLIAALSPQGTIADIGCGYGTLARQLVEDFPCQVIANTNAHSQATLIPLHPALTLLPGNWLDHPLPDQSLDAALAVESLSHFHSFDQFLARTSPTLKPGGHLIIADWFSDMENNPWLRRLARAGQIPPWRSADSLLTLAKNHGLLHLTSHDFSSQAAPTWSHLFGNSLLLPFRRPSLIPTLITQSLKNPALLLALPLIRLAYQSGHLQYHLISFQK